MKLSMKKIKFLFLYTTFGAGAIFLLLQHKEMGVHSVVGETLCHDCWNRQDLI